MLLKLQASIRHYIHKAWHILLSLNPHVLVDLSHEPLGLQLSDSKVIQWHIFENGICLVELFGGISFGLAIVL
jgi:hypothetical protein